MNTLEWEPTEKEQRTMTPRKIQIEIRQAKGNYAEALNALFGSNSFHWHPEYRLIIDGERATGWARDNSGRGEHYKQLADEARENGHKIFPDQIRHVYRKVDGDESKRRKKEAADAYRVECETKGIPVNRKKLTLVKRKAWNTKWWSCSGGMTNQKHKPVIIG
jgi:hypothetical protein